MAFEDEIEKACDEVDHQRKQADPSYLTSKEKGLIVKEAMSSEAGREVLRDFVRKDPSSGIPLVVNAWGIGLLGEMHDLVQGVYAESKPAA